VERRIRYQLRAFEKSRPLYFFLLVIASPPSALIQGFSPRFGVVLRWAMWPSADSVRGATGGDECCSDFAAHGRLRPCGGAREKVASWWCSDEATSNSGRMKRNFP